MSNPTIVRAIGALVFVVGLTIGIAACAPASSDAPPALAAGTSSSGSSPATPMASVPAATPELTFEQKVARHRIAAGQSEKELSADIMKEVNAWAMSGVDDNTATFKAFTDAGYTAAADTRKYADSIAALNAPVFAAALFGESWTSNPTAARFVKIQTELNAMNIDYHIVTVDSGEPFRISNDVTSYELRFGTTSDGNMSIYTVVNADIASRNAGYIQVENGLKQMYNTDFKPNPDAPNTVVLSGTYITNIR